jgi:hypothetical protein
MKELILVTAHCPDQKRKDKLQNLVNSLQPFKDRYDILISSHTHIPLEITEKVNYTIFDKENPILNDFKYLSSSWGIPFTNFKILSTFVGKGTYILAIFRLINLGLGLAKTMNYKKIHHLEYDAIINDDSFLFENSNSLDEYDYIFYTRSGNQDDFFLGFTFSFRTDKALKIFGSEGFDEEFCLYSLYRFGNIAPEMVMRNYIGDYKFLCKKLGDIEINGNEFGLSGNTYQPNWCVPFYDSSDNKFKFIAWNNYFKEGRECSIIINKEKYVNFGLIPLYNWNLIDLCSYDDLNHLQIILDGKIEYDLNFTSDYKKDFIVKNYCEQSNLAGYG